MCGNMSSSKRSRFFRYIYIQRDEWFWTNSIPVHVTTNEWQQLGSGNGGIAHDTKGAGGYAAPVWKFHLFQRWCHVDRIRGSKYPGSKLLATFTWRKAGNRRKMHQLILPCCQKRFLCFPMQQPLQLISSVWLMTLRLDHSYVVRTIKDGAAWNRYVLWPMMGQLPWC